MRRGRRSDWRWCAKWGRPVGTAGKAEWELGQRHNNKTLPLAESS